MKKQRKLLPCLIAFIAFEAFCQPQPGDWFREYNWNTDALIEGEQFLRVGGRYDYRNSADKFPEGHLKNGAILLSGKVDLKNAIRAEIVAEKVLCHDYTTGLAVAVNGHAPVLFSPAEGIPEPQEAYMHHYNAIAEIPLEMLNAKEENHVALQVDTFQHWSWPQNLIYGIKLRVYYKPGKSEPEITAANPAQDLQAVEAFTLDSRNTKDIQQVDYIAFYDGPDMDGNGIYPQWQYTWFRTEITNHIGTATKEPYNINWNTEWLPDQQAPVKICARVVFNNGLIYQTEAIEKQPPVRNYSVELCKPYNIPKQWVTRNEEYKSLVYMNGEPEDVEDARILWKSWSPGYMNGLYINDILVFIREGENYKYHEHDIPLSDLSVLNKGINIIKTGKTPRYNWQMVHGMEVQYPGPMLLVKYKSKN